MNSYSRKCNVINKKTNFEKSLDRISKACIIVNVGLQETLRSTKKEFAGIVQLVEHLLAKEKVASSSLAARSFFYRGLCPLYGDVAKWQGKGLQNPHHRFKSDRRLKRISRKRDFFYTCFPEKMFIIG